MRRTISLMALVMALFAMPALVSAQATPPSECVGLSSNDWADIQDTQCPLNGATQIADPQASDGSAVKVQAGDGWVLQYEIPAALAGTWHCYVSLKVVSSDTSGTACDAGIYDRGSNEQHAVPAFSIQAGPGGNLDGQYHVYDMGTQTLNSNEIFYVNAPPSSNTTVYVDRYFLVAPGVQGAATTSGLCNGLPAGSWAQILPVQFKNWTVLDNDPDAAGGYDGMARYSMGWANMWQVTANLTGTWHCYVSAKILTTNTSGTAFSFGVNGSGGMPDISIQAGPGGNLDGKYHIYDMGTRALDPSMTFWLMTGDSNTVVDVDQYILVAPGVQGTASVPPMCNGLPEGGWAQILPVQFNDWTVFDYDTDAAGGYAGMASYSMGWANQWRVPASLAGTWHCYVSAKVLTTNTSGKAFYLGVDGSGGVPDVNLQDGPGGNLDGQYHIYDMGTRPLGPGMTFWVMPADANTVVDVDQYILVDPNAQGAIATTPPECKGLSTSNWVDILPKDFAPWNTLTDDPDAAGGYNGAVYPNSGWVCQYPVPESRAGTYHCFVSLKISSTDPVGTTACGVGIWNGSSNSAWLIVNTNSTNLDGQYHVYDLGVAQLTSGSTFYVAAPNSNNTTVFLDRYFLMVPGAPGATATTPPQCVGLPTSDWVDILPKDFLIDTILPNDPDAAGGYAAQVFPHSGWVAQYRVPASQAGAWHCYASLKVSSTDTSGKACEVGIYNNATGSYQAVKAVNLDSGTLDDQYHVLDLGIQQTANTTFYVAAPESDNTTVYVDRYFLVKPQPSQRDKVSDLSAIPDGADVQLTSPVVVTTAQATFIDGSTFVEDPGRSSGIRCVFNTRDEQPGAGHSVTLYGTMATDAAGQRYINNCSTVTDSAGAAVGALGAGAKGITQSKPDMSSLLVRAWGNVTYVASDNSFYYIDDGSNIADASGMATGLRVKLDGLVTPVTDVPTVGQYVTTTGIVSKAVVQKGASNAVVPVLQSAANTLTILEPQFTLDRLNEQTIEVFDPDAPDGTVAMLLGGFGDPNVKYMVPANIAGTWHCSATVKCDATAGSGPAFSLGVYDPITLVSRTIMLENGAGDGLYHAYDLGTLQLQAGDYFWFAATANDGSPSVYVDKITLTSGK